MTDEQLKSRYGEEFPAAVTISGIRMPLKRETRFSRYYYNEDKKYGATVPRFFDASAKITLAELQTEWPTWSKSERSDFVQACSYMQDQADIADIVRFIMKSGDFHDWNAIALAISFRLPQEEAFAALRDALTQASEHPTANLAQALAATKHPNAAEVLLKHLNILWENSDLWKDDPFNNWVAFDATCCIQYLIELGKPASEFDEQVRALAKHPCKGNRENCVGYLKKHYAWL